MEFAREVSELTISNAHEPLTVAEFLGVSPSTEIEYLASHLYEIDVNIVKSLNPDHLTGDLTPSRKLQIRSEDSLLDFSVDLGGGLFLICRTCSERIFGFTGS
jgi:hypothetical protein